MKKNFALLLFIAVTTTIIYAYHGGAALHGIDGTGVSGSGCGSCHGAATSMTVTVELDSSGVAVTSYHPGMSYTVKISGTNTSTSTLPKFGFQLAVVNSTASANAGTFGALPTNVQATTPAQSGLNHTTIEQSTQITATSGTGGNGTTYVESIPWTAPVAGTGSVKLYGVVNAVNNNNNDGSTDKYKVASPVTITEAVTPVVASVSISQTSGTNPFCAGSSVSFTATPTNGGSAPTYQWKVNGVNAGTGAVFTTTSLTNGQAVTCVMTSNLSGVTGNPATSNSITVAVNSTVTPSVSIAATSGTSLCTGQSFSFAATPVNGGTPSYQWKVNGNNAGTGSTFTSVLNNNDAVTCVMTSTATCASPVTVTSNSISVTVTGSVTPTITVSTATPTVCSGQSVSFTSTITNGGASPSYQWKVNGNNTATGSAFSSILNNGDVVSCVLTSNASCASATTAASNVIAVTVNPVVTPTITISTPSTNICAGQSVSFTSNITNGGSSPSYQWKVNGSNVATGTTFSSVLNNNDVVTCVLTSNASCTTASTATSNSITISTAASVVPVVSISADNSSVCTGATVNFTATPANGGTAPTYQWKLNGNNAGTGSVYSSVFNNGDAVNCVMTSNSSCATVNTVTSNTVTVTVHTPPTITIAPSVNVSYCNNDSVQLTANGGTTFIWSNNATGSSIWVSQQAAYTVTGTDVNSCSAVSSPVNVTASTGPSAVITQNGDTLTASAGSSYQWFWDGNTIAITQTIVATHSGVYSVKITDANGCSAVSADVNVVIAAIGEVNSLAGVKIYPVPNNGSFIVETAEPVNTQLTITDIYGRLIFFKKEISSKESISIENLMPQIYFVTLRNNNRTKVIKMEVR